MLEIPLPLRSAERRKKAMIFPNAHDPCKPIYMLLHHPEFEFLTHWFGGSVGRGPRSEPYCGDAQKGTATVGNPHNMPGEVAAKSSASPPVLSNYFIARAEFVRTA